MKLCDVYRRADLAIRLGATDYACKLGEQILQTFPFDLRTRTLLAHAYLDQGRVEAACQQCDLILELDPESISALSADGVAHSAAGQLNAAVRAFEQAYELNPGNLAVRESLTQLYDQLESTATEPSPAPAVAVIRWQLRHGDLENALDAVNQYLLTRPGDIYVLLGRAEALWKAGRRDEAERACRQILARHPRCLKPRLILGQLLASDRDREIEGVELLHAALIEDPGCSVARPLFRGRPCVLPFLTDDLDAPICDDLLTGPPELEAALATLPAGSVDNAEADSDWRPPEDDPAASGATDRYPSPNGAAPVEAARASTPAADAPSQGSGATAADIACLLAISCRGPLVARYGFDEFQRLERRLQTVARELAFLGTRFVVAFVDDPGSMAQQGLAPVWSTDPHEIKGAIDALDRAVTHDGRGVDGILIIGGDDIVPFYHLPNPADDDDSAILSDNPYGMEPNGSVYAPEIPVGRLPDGSGGNLSLLLRQVDTLLDLRHKPPLADTGPKIVKASLAALGAIGIGVTSSLTYGCTASVWEPAAEAVFAALGSASPPRLSPPNTCADFKPHWVAGRRFLYFNLHGSPDSVAWYGESAAGSNGAHAPVLPVALTPDQLPEVDLGAPVVVSQASYGANVVDKSAANSLALRFLNEGAAAFVGSTAAAYGATAPPLRCSDLLGRMFWMNVRQGDAVGLALQRAKRQYVHTVVEKQGYLDGDDQKTLLEFVLYGDPLLSVFQTREDLGEALEVTATNALALICNRAPAGAGRPGMAPTYHRIAMQHLVERCPLAARGSVRIHRRSACQDECDRIGHPGRGGDSAADPIEIITVTARNEITVADSGRVAITGRVTLSESGDVLKCVVSR